MYTFFISAIALLSAVLASPVELFRRDPLSGFSLCDGNPSALALTSLTYTPAPPQAGQPLSITVSGVTTADVNAGASIRVKATWIFGITVLDQTLDLCSQEGVSCPIPAGNNSITFSVQIPSTKPSIKVSVTADATNADASRITCVKNPNFQL
ncbi:Phosphatidylglycerol/phosphatidylinositol transfer protein [Phlyctochytrium bullatum]|nr:Phosphatidylglycerol/phosphatidylinositol transfer protein [Phlyctochytrium bullatum]